MIKISDNSKIWSYITPSRPFPICPSSISTSHPPPFFSTSMICYFVGNLLSGIATEITHLWRYAKRQIGCAIVAPRVAPWSDVAKGAASAVAVKKMRLRRIWNSYWLAVSKEDDIRVLRMYRKLLDVRRGLQGLILLIIGILPRKFWLKMQGILQSWAPT
jgi:hypothetical protein